MSMKIESVENVEVLQNQKKDDQKRFTNPKNENALTTGHTQQSILTPNSDRGAITNQNALQPSPNPSGRNVRRNQRTRSVCIYMSYSSSDMVEEKNYVIRHIFPELKKTCSQFGIQFNMVDMGCNDVFTDVRIQGLIKEELEMCKALKNRPNFLALIGDKYGEATFPFSICSDEFDMLLFTLNQSGDNGNLLKKWFQKDENANPPVYILKDVSAHIKDNDVASKQKKVTGIMSKIQRSLSNAASLARQQGNMSDEGLAKYSISSLENELQNGILSSDAPTKECVSFVRSFQIDNLTMNDNNKSIKHHFDLSENGNRCEATKTRFDNLKDQMTVANKNHTITLETKWLQGGIDPKYSAHKTYLKSFGESVKASVMDLLHEYIDKVQNTYLTKETLINYEIFHHRVFCEKKCGMFIGRDDIIGNIKTMLSKSPNNSLLLHGPSGCGKTSLLATFSKQSKTILNKPDLVTIVRFLGTSSRSYHVENVLQSICDEIIKTYKFNDLVFNPNKCGFNHVKILFLDLLHRIESNETHRSLLLVLDGLDQLTISPNNRAVVNWLPTQKFTKICILLSTESNRNNILRSFRERFGPKNSLSPTISLEGITDDSPNSSRSDKSTKIKIEDLDQYENSKVKKEGEANTNIIRKISSKTSKVSPRVDPININLQRKTSNSRNNKVVPGITVRNPSPRPAASPRSEGGEESANIQNSLEVTEDPANRKDSLVLPKDATFKRELTYEETLLQGREESSMDNNDITTPSGTLEKSKYLLRIPDSLKYEERSEMLKLWLERQARNLSQLQSDYIKSCLEICSQPIYVRLIVVEALKMKSFDEIGTFPMTPSDLIASLFSRLEEQYGTTLVSHTLAYITSSTHGLSECELLDILSLDNTVLNSVYEKSDPPLNDVIRVPVLIWKRIRHSLGVYLTENLIDGFLLLNWCHRMFWEVANRRYLKEESKVKYINKIITEYFLGNHAHSIKNITLEKAGGKKINAYRHVSPQPLEFQREQYNVRKLVELPGALMKSKNLKTLFREILFNFHWIIAKINAMGFEELLRDFETYLQFENNKEVQILYDVLKLSVYNINKDPNTISNQLLGRLLDVPKEKQNIKYLIEAIHRHLDSSKRPLLCLRNQCLISPSTDAMHQSLKQPGSILFLTCMPSEELILCCSVAFEKLFINFYSLNDWDLIHSLISDTPGYKMPVFCLAKSKQYLYVGHEKLGIVDIISMSVRVTLEVHNARITCVEENVDGNMIAMTYSNGLLRVYDVINGKIMADIGISCSTISHMMFLNDSLSLLLGPTLDSTWMEVNYDELKINLIPASTIGNVNSTSSILKMTTQNAMIVSNDNEIHSWCLQRFKYHHNYLGHVSNILSLAQIGNDMFASGSADSTIKLWYFSKKILVQTLRGHVGSINCLLYHKETNQLVSGSKDHTIKFWDLGEFTCRDTYHGHSSNILGFCSSNSLLMSYSTDSIVNVYEMRNKDSIGKLMPLTKMYHSQSCSVQEHSHDFKYMTTLSKHEKVILWNVENGEGLWEFTGSVTTSCFVQDEPKFLVGTKEGELLGFILEKDDKVEQIFSRDIQTGISLIKHLGGNTVLVFTDNRSISTFDFNENIIEKAYECNDAITYIEVKQKRIALAKNDGKIDVLGVSENFKISLEFTLEGSKNQDANSCVSISETQGIIMVCDWLGNTFTWNLESGKSLSNLSCASDAIQCCQINEASGKFIVASKDPTKALVEWSKDIPENFVGQSSNISCFKLSDDCKVLFSGSRGGTMTAWDAVSKQPIDYIDFNSSIVSIGVSKLIDQWFYRLAITLNSGRIGFVDFRLTSKEIQERPIASTGHLIMLNHTNDTQVQENQPETKKIDDGNEKDDSCCTIL